MIKLVSASRRRLTAAQLLSKAKGGLTRLAARGSYKFYRYSTPDYFWSDRIDFGNQIWSPGPILGDKMVRPDRFSPDQNFRYRLIHYLKSRGHAEGHALHHDQAICSYVFYWVFTVALIYCKQKSPAQADIEIHSYIQYNIIYS